ncbi:MAG TPA: NlpC/P60 family protein [Candidatus Acidoferrum sp.]
MRTRLNWRGASSFVAVLKMTCLGMACVSWIACASAGAQVVRPVHESDSNARLLSVEEGRAIVNAALQQEPLESGRRDCSHVVHQIYASAGFEYAYASSFEIYAGNEKFERVRSPRAGDLIAWPGHVGIVVDPQQHSFYSLVRTGLEAQDYDSAYWRSRGRPRFYRYILEGDGVLSASSLAGSSVVSNSHAQHIVGTTVEDRATAVNASSNRPPTVGSLRSEVIHGPPAPPVSSAPKTAEVAFGIPAKVIIAAGNKPPTREEVAEGISELSDALGRELRSDDPLESRVPVVIVEKFQVERVDVQSDHGWASLSVESKVLISGGAAQVKHRHEKTRWELRRTESGWEAVPPPDRIYVPRDVAVKNLASNLAQLTSGDGAVEHQQGVLRQESQLASLLNTLLENGRDR